MDAPNNGQSGPARPTLVSDAPPTAAAAPGAPPADAGEDHAGEINVRVNFPKFDLIALRNAGPKVRSATDRAMDYAQIRDVQAVVHYARQCAIAAAVQVQQATTAAERPLVEALVVGECRKLAGIFDRILHQEIEKAIGAYHQQMRSRVWYRRFGRWISETYVAAVTELGIREPIPTDHLQPPRPKAPEITIISSPAPSPEKSTDPAVASSVETASEQPPLAGKEEILEGEQSTAAQPPVEGR